MVGAQRADLHPAGDFTIYFIAASWAPPWRDCPAELRVSPKAFLHSIGVKYSKETTGVATAPLRSVPVSCGTRPPM
jgi:hypothetical protein